MPAGESTNESRVTGFKFPGASYQVVNAQVRNNQARLRPQLVRVFVVHIPWHRRGVKCKSSAKIGLHC
jgi:hypothetical protein